MVNADTACMTNLPPIKQHPSPNFSERDGSPVDLVVAHRPVGSYLGSIATLCDPAHQASAHIVLGRPSPGAPLEVTQLVAWSKKSWSCMAFNSRSDGCEFADAAWDGTDPEAWRAAARIVAFRLKVRGLRPRWSRNGQGPGFCRHYDLGAAGGGHTDPTTSTVQWLRFVVRVKWEFLRGGFPAEWGVDHAGEVPPPPAPVKPVAVKKPKADPLRTKGRDIPGAGQGTGGAYTAVTTTTSGTTTAGTNISFAFKPTGTTAPAAPKKAAPKKATPKPAAKKPTAKPAPKTAPAKPPLKKKPAAPKKNPPTGGSTRKAA